MRNKRVIANASWIIVSRIIQAFFAVIISMLTARYLGPSNFGIINYVASLVAFATPVMKLGLDAILVREIINHPDEEGQTLGTATVLNLISSVLCMLGTVTFCALVNRGEDEIIIVCLLYSLMLPAQAVEMIMYWYQAKLLSKYTSLVSLGAYILISAYKIFLLICNKNVYWFAISNAIDYMLIGIVLHILYRKLGSSPLSFSLSKAKQMLSQGKFYIVSAMMVTVFAQTDKIMLKYMIDETATGFYAAATTCAGMTSFVFAAIIDSARPSIFENKQKGEEYYERSVRMLYCEIIYLSLAQCLVITVFSKHIIYLLYGAAYKPAISALRIVVWYTTFSYMGSVRNIWILAEGKQKYLWILNLSGASANVLLNIWLIPRLGVTGAAMASLITQFFTNVSMSAIIRPLRRNNELMFSALDLRNIWGLISQIRK